MKIVPHTIPLLLSLSADDFAVPFHIQKSSQITTKKSKYLSTTTFQWLTCENTPNLLDFTMQVQLVKNTPKTWKMAEPIGSCWSNLPWHLTKATYEGSGAHCAWLCIILFFKIKIMTVYMYFFGCLLGKCMCAWGFGKSPLFKHVFFLSPVSSMILDLGKIHACTVGFCKNPRYLIGLQRGPNSSCHGKCVTHLSLYLQTEILLIYYYGYGV